MKVEEYVHACARERDEVREKDTERERERERATLTSVVRLAPF